VVDNPEPIAFRHFAGYTQKWFSFDTSQKCLQRLFLGIDFRFSRAIGATHEALLFFYCRLLPPRQIAKLLWEIKTTGAGDGNPTQQPSLVFERCAAKQKSFYGPFMVQ
jgi:hypothetical protein